MHHEWPKRLAETTDDHTLRGVLLAHGDDTPPAASQKTLQAGLIAAGVLSIGLPSAAAAATVSSGASASKVALHGAWWKLAAAKWVVVPLVAVGGGVAARVALAPAPRVSAAISQPESAISTPTPATPQMPEAEVAAPTVEPPLPSVPPRNEAHVMPPRSVAIPAPHGDTLGDEARVLSQAQESLNRGDATKAMSYIRAFEARFPYAQLAREKDLLKSRVEKKLGIERSGSGL